MEPWDFNKSSVLLLLVDMECSLSQSFYLRHSLKCYTVCTTVGFLVKIMEA
jgi:hypothetical protein